MPEPTFTETTERFYKRLPQVYRDQDAEQGWVFKSWLSGMCDQLGEVDTLVDRFTFYKPGVAPALGQSDLTDPNKADTAWLPWLAQLVGARLDPHVPVGMQRERISTAILGIKPGSKDAIALAAKPALAGDQYVKVYDHSTSLLDIGTASQWDVLVVTRASETLENRMPITQSTMASSGGWLPTSYRINLVGAATWTTGTATTHTTGTTNPLRGSNYQQYGGGTAYVQGTAYPGVVYKGSVFVRGASTAATLSLVYLNASNTVLGQTDLSVTGTSGWVRKRWTGTATPAGTVAIRLQVNVTSGTMDVTFPFVGPDDAVLFDSSTPGVVVETTSVKMPPVNFWNNASYDVASGWFVPAGVTITKTSDRFWNNNSSALINTGTVVPYVQPVVATEVFEGESVTARVRVEQAQDGNSCYFLFFYTLADGTNVQHFSSTQSLTTDEFVEIDFTDTAPAQAKSMTIALYFNTQFYYNYYVDGGQINKGPEAFSYGDGDTFGWSWTNPAAIDASPSYAPMATAAVITTDPLITGSNVIEVTAQINGVVRFEENTTAGYMVASAGDPFTFMITTYARQGSGYIGVMEVVFTDSGGVVKGNATTNLTVTTTPTQTSIVSTVAPTGATRAFMRVLVYGAAIGDKFVYTMAGGRLGSISTWIAKTADPVSQVINAGEKPAGILLHQADFDAQWQTIEADRPEWNSGTPSTSWEPNTWTQIEETGL